MRFRSFRLLLCLILLCALIPYSALASLRVTFFDAVQGAALLQADGQILLIDSGMEEDSKRLLSSLNDFDIPKIDLMAATFLRDDSTLGISEVLGKYEVGTLWLPGLMAGEESIDPVSGVKAVTPAPDDQMEVGKAKVSAARLSGYSTVAYLVLRVEYDGKSFLFMPGADALGEAPLVESGTDLHADVISMGGGKIPSRSILDQATPLWVIAGGELQPDTLTGMQDSDFYVLNPAMNGTVTFTLHGKAIEAEYEASGITIQNSVNVRKEATTKAGRTLTLAKGSVIGILGTAASEEGLWYHIEADGKSGYVRGDLIKEISNEEAEKLLAIATPKPKGVNGGSKEEAPEEAPSCH
jgi:beta-lactamase superfamily II metal-dependent hydrolase